MPRTIPAVVLPNPDDATNGLVVGVRVTFFRGAAGAQFFQVEVPNDPDGPFTSPVTAVPAAARTQGRDFVLACMAVYKTARGYV